MDSFGSIAWSSVGKKVIMGLTGLALFLFVCVHLIGNLTLFIGPDAFNNYAHFLEHLLHGWLIYAMEIGIVALFLFHVVSAISVAWNDKRAARQVGYRYSQNAGGKSRKTLSSRSMIYTGILLLIFVIAHIWLFKFGDHEIYGEGKKNLYKTVVTAFKNPGLVHLHRRADGPAGPCTCATASGARSSRWAGPTTATCRCWRSWPWSSPCCWPSVSSCCRCCCISTVTRTPCREVITNG